MSDSGKNGMNGLNQGAGIGDKARGDPRASPFFIPSMRRVTSAFLATIRTLHAPIALGQSVSCAKMALDTGGVFSSAVKSHVYIFRTFE